MSIQLIQRYYAEIDRIIRYGGSWNESSLLLPVLAFVLGNIDKVIAFFR
jgi:hypothetical protein